VHDFLWGIVGNLFADVIFLGLTILLGWLFIRVTGRSKLLRFFDVKDAKRIVVYLSNLTLVPGGAIGVDGIQRSYQMGAVPQYEVDLIPVFQRLFNFIVPGIESQAGPLRTLLLSDVAVEFRASPLQLQEVDPHSTFIAVGSPGYNLASKVIETKFRSSGKFVNDMAGIQVERLAPEADARCSFVERVRDHSTGQTAFYVAGLSALGTMGAVYYLATRWDYLAKKYPNNKPFLIMIRVLSDDGRKHDVLYERG
jgi:hypothetical protein